MGRKSNRSLTESQLEHKRIRQRIWIARRRRDYFAKRACADCGLSFVWCPMWGARNLELDHIDPATKVTHNIWSWNVVKREAEIAKCQVLCKACHLEKSLRERELGFRQPDISEVPF